MKIFIKSKKVKAPLLKIFFLIGYFPQNRVNTILSITKEYGTIMNCEKVRFHPTTLNLDIF